MMTSNLIELKLLHVHKFVGSTFTRPQVTHHFHTGSITCRTDDNFN